MDKLKLPFHFVKRRIAKYYLVFLRKFFGLRVVGITGSAGKTTTKEMIASILGQDGETVASFANIDPVYNIPSTILRCRPSTRYLVLEMGVEYPDEMDFYLWLARPDVGVVTNIYPTHILFFKSIKGVAKEKEKLIRGLVVGGTAVLNFENLYTKQMGKRFKGKVVWFGGRGNVRARNIKIDPGLHTKYKLSVGEGEVFVDLPIIGNQFVYDSLAAAGIAKALNIPISLIKKGLESYSMPEHRMNIVKLKSGALLIDDSYNNNPSAAKEALKTLDIVRGKKKTLLVFGDMRELGKGEIKYHKEIGNLIAKSKIDLVIGVGPLSKYVLKDEACWFQSWKDALPVVRSLIHKNMIVFVKGSRSIGLNNLVEKL